MGFTAEDRHLMKC